MFLIYKSESTNSKPIYKNVNLTAVKKNTISMAMAISKNQ
ncbi:hypothetical protein FEM21_16710 [Flavobacterium seoulense]|uniref:Uncharacterized protein n=1 Tax=Flavobacterium seoulense TaxID=1492738 RepID=A0A066WWN4_9FLAO|nr:hypothetical protein FEM21_16710 [Flavobacterium seoulense]